MRHLVALFVFVTALSASAAEPTCTTGHFVSDSAALQPLLPTGSAFAAIDLDGGQLSLGICGATTVRLKAAKRATLVKARWSACGESAPVRMAGRITGAACDKLSARMRVGKRKNLPITAGLSPCNGGPVVRVAGGVVCGASANGVRAFNGLPYAAPPTGARRWRAPAAPAAWTGVRSGLAAGASCPQDIPVIDARTGAEDCLYLNVVTPDPAPSAAPVMVWIHGGGFTSGDGRQYVGSTDGTEIARRTGTIVVSINYRLGALGFLAHPAFTAEDPSHPWSGNYGFEDQIAALTWVRDNITAFGGDANNVTIFGESAGGWSVCAHLASPFSKGLFHKAIVQSGLCTIPMPTLAAAEAQGQTLAENAGCSGAADPLACLRGKTANEIIDALPPDPHFAFTAGTWGSYQPTFDGHVLPRQMADAFATGEGLNRVPVLIGSNHDEGTLFTALAHDNVGAPLTAEQYPDRLAYFLPDPDNVVAAEAHYPLGNYIAPGAALADAFGDGFLACPTIKAGQLLAATLGSTPPVYLYQFEFPDAPFQVPLLSSFPLGAFHSGEIQYIFGVPGAGGTFTADEATLSQTMMGYWTRFAATGNPNGNGLPTWPVLNATDQFMGIDVTSAVGTGAQHDDCAFWDSLDYLRSPLSRQQ